MFGGWAPVGADGLTVDWVTGLFAGLLMFGLLPEEQPATASSPKASRATKMMFLFMMKFV